jgi:hypothetical protein
MEQARAIWHNAAEPKGTDVERYLRGRAMSGPIPRTIRAARLYHRESGREVPALVGAIQNAEGRITAVQRIYIDPVTAKKVSAKPAKKTKGPMQDGAVRLAKPARILGIAEGIETAMSAMHMFSLPVWACLGAQRLKAVWIPEEVEQLVLFADRGEVGMREAIDAAEVYEAKGLSTEIVLPDEPHKDFNDWHQARAGGRRA